MYIHHTHIVCQRSLCRVPLSRKSEYNLYILYTMCITSLITFANEAYVEYLSCLFLTGKILWSQLSPTKKEKLSLFRVHYLLLSADCAVIKIFLKNFLRFIFLSFLGSMFFSRLKKPYWSWKRPYPNKPSDLKHLSGLGCLSTEKAGRRSNSS